MYYLSKPQDPIDLLHSDQWPERPNFDVQLATMDAAGMALPRQHEPVEKFNAQMPWLRTQKDLLLANARGPFHLLTPDNHGTQPHCGALPMALLSLPTLPVDFEYELQSGGKCSTPSCLRSGPQVWPSH